MANGQTIHDSQPSGHSALIDWALRQLSLLPQGPTQREQCEIFKQALARIVARVGQERFEAAIRRCVDECKFFPMPADVTERVPPATAVSFDTWQLTPLPPGERYYGLADLKELPAYKAIMEKFNAVQRKN